MKCAIMEETSAHHPVGESVLILGLHARNNGRTCGAHYCCGGECLSLDSIVRLRVVQVWVRGREESAIAAHWVSDGIDKCRVGFLGRDFVKDADKYNGKLVQITEFLFESEEESDVQFSDENAGVCRGIVVDTVWI